jgi:hypothetical protein
MNNDLKNILSNSNKDIDNQQLMDYLSNRLSKDAQHEVEQQMSDDPFFNDAIEGLQSVKPNTDVNQYVQQLNIDLQKQIAKNKNRRLKRRWKDQPWTYVVIAVILMLAVVSYYILKRLL